MISATITFNPGESERTFTPRRDPGNPWRFIGDTFAADLTPICYLQAQDLQAGEAPPLFDRVEIWPVRWGIPDSLVTDHPAEVEEVRREFYDPKPEAEKAAWPFPAWLEQTGKRLLWKKHCTPEPARHWLTPVGGAGFELFLHARKRHFTNPFNVGLSALARIRFRADFWLGDCGTTIYLAACLETPLTPDESRTSPAFQAQEEARRLAIAQDREAAERHAATARNILEGAAETAEKLQPLTDLYQDKSKAAVREAAAKKGVPELFIDWALLKFHGSKFPSPDQADKEIKGGPVGKALASAGHGTSRPTFARWLAALRAELEKRGHLQPRAKGPAAKRAREYNLDRHAAPPTSDDNTGDDSSRPDTLGRELGELPDDE